MKVISTFNSVEELGTVKALGRSAEVYKFEEDKLIKLYYNKVPVDFAEIESANNNEAHRLGCSAPKYFGIVKAGNRIGIMIEKINGHSLTELALSGPDGLLESARELAKIQLKFHQIESKLVQSYKATVLHALETEVLSILSAEEKEKVIKSVSALPDDNKMLHLDYYTDNVLLNEDKVAVVIDWLTSCTGSPGADVASTKYLFQEGPMMPGLTEEQVKVINSIRNSVFDEYYKYYLEHSTVTEEEVKAYRIPTLILRLYNFNDEGERFSDGLDQKLHAEIAKL